MSTSFFSGLLRGFSDQTSTNRQQAQADQERQLARDQKVMELLLESDDDEIRGAALQGLADLAAGTYQSKSGLGRFLGRGGSVNPAVTRLVDLMRAPTTREVDIPVTDITAAPTTPPTAAPVAAPSVHQTPPVTAPPRPSPAATSPAQPGSAAMAPPPTEEGGGINPAVLARTPPPSPTALAGGLATPGTLPAAMATAPTTHTKMTVPSGPRQVFLRPEERMRRQAVAKAQGDVEGEVAGLIAAGFTDQEARDLVKQTYARRTAGTGAPYRAVAGEILDPQTGQWIPTQAVFNAALGQYTDAAGNPITNFRPRSTGAVNDYGDDRESIAQADFGRSFAQLTPAEKAIVNQKAAELRRVRSFQSAAGTAEANAGRALSTGERVNLTTRLQDDWRRLDAPVRVMGQQLGIMQSALARFDADPVGASEAIRVTFEKILDPNSVVREAEYARQGIGLSLLQRMEGFIQAITAGGGKLPKDALAGMVATAEQFVQGAQQWNAGEAEKIRQLAVEAGIPVSMVLPAQFTGGAPGGAGGGAGQPPPAPGGTTAPPPPGGGLTGAPPPALGTDAFPTQYRELADKITVRPDREYEIFDITIPGVGLQSWAKYKDGRLVRVK